MHRSHLGAVLQRLRAAGLVANGEFGMPVLDFLGHRVSATGIKLLPDRVQSIMDQPQSATAKDLQKFLGVINLYRRFLPAPACTHKPLTQALQGSPQPNTPLEWAAAMQAAF